MEQISLLFSNSSNNYFNINPTTANDLGIVFLSENISDSPPEQEVIRKILMKMPVDQQIISYRNDIYR